MTKVTSELFTNFPNTGRGPVVSGYCLTGQSTISPSSSSRASTFSFSFESSVPATQLSVHAISLGKTRDWLRLDSSQKTSSNSIWTIGSWWWEIARTIVKGKFTFTEMVKLTKYILVIFWKIACFRLKPSKESIKLGDRERKSELVNSADKSQVYLRDF